MELKYDPDYQRELEIAVATIQAPWTMYSWISLLLATLWLAVVVALTHVYSVELSPSTAISIVIAAAAICLVAVINSGLKKVFSVIGLLASITEWYGKKQLGEIVE